MSIEFCGCGRIKGDVGLYHPRCYECMNDLRKVRPEWFEEKGNPKPMKKDTIISLPVEEPAAAPALHEWPVGDQVATLQASVARWMRMAAGSETAALAAESRVAVLEGLLREFRDSLRPHLYCKLHAAHPFNDLRCDVCKRADSFFAPAPLTEGE